MHWILFVTNHYFDNQDGSVIIIIMMCIVLQQARARMNPSLHNYASTLLQAVHPDKSVGRAVGKFAVHGGVFPRPWKSDKPGQVLVNPGVHVRSDGCHDSVQWECHSKIVTRRNIVLVKTHMEILARVYEKRGWQTTRVAAKQTVRVHCSRRHSHASADQREGSQTLYETIQKPATRQPFKIKAL